MYQFERTMLNMTTGHKVDLKFRFHLDDLFSFNAKKKLVLVYTIRRKKGNVKVNITTPGSSFDLKKVLETWK